MKGLVYHGPNVLRYEDIPDVEPGGDEVKIRVKAAGICGSDVHGYLGLTGRRIAPMVMGHEFAGVVEEVGAGVSGWEKGDRVTAYPVYYCGECPKCRDGMQHLCERRRQYGVLSENGAFADFLCVPARCCYRLADRVSFAIGSLMEPLAVSYRAVHRVAPEAIAGANVFLVGTGTIGLLALACAKMRNPARIIVSDLSDARLEVARRMGATDGVNPSKEDVREKVLELTGGVGADIAFEAVGAAPTVRQAMSALRVGGTAVWIGNNKPTVEVNMQEIVTRELTVRGSFLYRLDEFETVVGLLNRGAFDAGPVISHQAPLSEGAALFAKLAGDPGDWIKVILTA